MPLRRPHADPTGAPRPVEHRRDAPRGAALPGAIALVGCCALLHAAAVAAFVPASTGRRLVPLVARAADADGEPKEAEVVLGAAMPMNLGVDSEVVSESGSRPAKLLYSPGVQRLVSLLTKLKDNKSGGGSALKSLLEKFTGALGKIADSEVPESFEADFEEALDKAELLTNAAVMGEEGDWRGPLREFSKLRLSKRLPEVIDQLLPWDEIYPGSLAAQTKIDQSEVRNSLMACFQAIKLDEVATWTDAEVAEAGDLVERSEVLKEVSSVVEKVVEESWTNLVGTATAVAASVALVPFVVLGVVLAACCACLNPGGDPSGGLPPSVPSGTEFQMLPLYKLADKIGGGG